MADEPRNAQSSSGPDDAKRGLTPKQLAAQAKAEAEAASLRRERLIRTLGAVVVLLLVVGIVSVGYFSGRGDSPSPNAAASPDPAAQLPDGVDSDTFGVPVGTGWKAKNAAKLPTLEIWEDFQCPSCAQLEAVAGQNIVSQAEQGKVKLLLRPATFLDDNLPQSNRTSARATSAWGCAISAGKATQYHSAVFAAQPATEGDGITDETLTQLGKDVGLTGAEFDTFSKCVADGSYRGWAANSNEKFAAAKISGTPTLLLNGKEIKASTIVAPSDLTKVLAAATAK